MLKLTHSSQQGEPQDSPPQSSATNLDELLVRIQQLESAQRVREERIALLSEENQWLRQHLFGRTSEKTAREEINPDQWRLIFNEAEVLASEPAGETSPIEVPAHERKKRGHKPLPAHLERREELHDLPAEQKICPQDHSLLERIGEETHEQYEYIRAKVRVVVHVRPKYACPCCHQGVRIAPPPAQLIPKSIATPSLLAEVTTAKFVDGLPLYRHSKQLARLSIPVGPATLGHWMQELGNRHVVPLINLMQEQLLASPLVHSDETTLQVLKSEKSPTADHYIWVRLGVMPAETEPIAVPERRIVLFTYTPYRNMEVARELFAGFKGQLVSDGLNVYDSVAEHYQLVHGGCVAHCRRGFEEARQVAKTNDAATHARTALDYIRALYRIEREIQSCASAEKLAVRRERSAPIVKDFNDWLDALAPKVWPEGKLGQAIAYAINQREKLWKFLEHSELPIDNNACERALRPFVTARKVWLFCKTPAGAQASANLYSLVESARANHIEPHAYLSYIYERLAAARTVEDFEQLLPWNVKRDWAHTTAD